MAVKAVVSKAVRKAVEKGDHIARKHGKAKKGFDRHGLFLFETGCNLQESLESSKADGIAHEKQMLQLMYMYQTYHNIVQISQYASRGSKLVCQYGTKPALLDTLEDHGVYAGTRPVMTCADCERVNLHDFGSCMCPERFYENRLPMTVAVHKNGIPAKQAPYNKYPHICVPLVNTQKGWYQAETGVFVEESNGTAYQALLDRAFLVCQYGGMITIPEVPVDEVEMTQDKTIKRYVVLSDATRVRETPNVNDNNIITGLDAGTRVNVIGDKRETENTDKGIRYWVEIEYEYENGETAWISDENILPDEPVVTKDFPEEIVRYVNGIPDKTKTPINNWYVAGGGAYNGDDIILKDDPEERYRIAVGPKVINPKYSDAGKVRGDDFKAFNGKVDVELVNKNDESKTKVIKCFRRDSKGHTYSQYPDGHKNPTNDTVEVRSGSDIIANGLVQTGISYPKASGKHIEWAKDNFDGSIIEFCSDKSCINIIEKREGIKLNEYKIRKTIAYLTEEQL